MVLICWATRVLQWLLQKVEKCKFTQILKDKSKFALFSVTRKHEVGIASNHKSECYGEFFLSLAHTARHTWGVTNS